MAMTATVGMVDISLERRYRQTQAGYQRVEADLDADQAHGLGEDRTLIAEQGTAA
jgi:hypothetical protein